MAVNKIGNVNFEEYSGFLYTETFSNQDGKYNLNFSIDGREYLAIYDDKLVTFFVDGEEMMCMTISHAKLFFSLLVRNIT